ncbi:Ca2+:H+ antiporter [Emericellopsis cladophorae]|uniref:Ca2+:H+ antiporter n=1 Tax=Emericellopsis cladophorae TaxID=2686198 RepID=A0A9P9Y121_9HYPO|nr:Ca2+:H+ antiporter [Emericellopsis cladophorae]KAI6781618.1 Ca2+:H+ antiporter [Emericellopsis cladophorae]
MHHGERPARTSLGQYARSFRHALFASRLNILLVFVPAGVVTYLTQAPPVAVFITNAIAIIPLSALLTDATERIAADAGDTIGALLNISLGNLVELILFVALANGHTRIVEASILGSILVNILLILGSALLACSVLGMDTTYTTAGTQVLGSLLFVSVFAFLMPTAFEYAFESDPDPHTDTLEMSRITACVVLAIYVLYVVHELQAPAKTVAALQMKTLDLEASSSSSGGGGGSAEPETTQVSPPQNIAGGVAYPLPLRTIRFADENLVDAADGPPNVSARTSGEFSKPFESGPDSNPRTSFAVEDDRGRSSFTAARTAPPSAYRQSISRGRSISLTSLNGRPSRDSSAGSESRRAILRSALPTMRTMRSYDDEAFVDLAEGLPHHTTRAIERTVAILVLIVSSGIMSMNAEFLVSTIDQITHDGHLSESLIGLIILPIVGNMAEYITVVTVACREKLDLAVAVSVGSSIQIALCVAPLTVMAGWVLGVDLMLTFDFFEMAALMGTVLLVNIIILSESSGGARSNALRGGLICGSYAIITIGAYLAPSQEP